MLIPPGICQLVIGYQLEAQRVPDNGVGSLIQFTAIDPDGVLNRGGRTLRTAAALERAVFNYAETPTPSVVLKANVPMDANKATAILNAWKQARQTKGTAFLSDNVDMQSVGFNGTSTMSLFMASLYKRVEHRRKIGLSIKNIFSI